MPRSLPLLLALFVGCGTSEPPVPPPVDPVVQADPPPAEPAKEPSPATEAAPTEMAAVDAALAEGTAAVPDVKPPAEPAPTKASVDTAKVSKPVEKAASTPKVTSTPKTAAIETAKVIEPKPKVEAVKPVETAKVEVIKPIETPKPVEVAKVEPPKPVEVAKVEPPKPVEVAKVEPPKPVEVAKVEPPKPAETAKPAILPVAAEVAVVAKPKVEAPPAVPLDPNCNPNSLDAVAAKGALTGVQVSCLEASYAKVSRAVDKERVSLTLVENAIHNTDGAAWVPLVERHLRDIDPTNAALAYRYAFYKFEHGDPSGSMKWANVAFSNRSGWTGTTYTDRTFSLYKLRAACAQALWKQAEADAAADGGDETKAKALEMRALTRRLATEWFAFATDAGKDTTVATKLCVMTGASACTI